MREIIPNVLWIGNAFDARNVKAVMDAGFQVVVDLAIEEPPIQLPREVVYCRFPLLDGEGNSPVLIRASIDLIVSFVNAQTKTLVACSGGMNRSPLIVSAVVAQVESIQFDDAIGRVTSTGPCDISPNLYAAVKHLL
ncbi:MAG: dual specificity protein phosphatase [Planctomycetaceae bacterium]